MLILTPGFSSEDSFEPEAAGLFIPDNVPSSTTDDKLEPGEPGAEVQYFYRILNENSETMNNDVPSSLGENQVNENKRVNNYFFNAKFSLTSQIYFNIRIFFHFYCKLSRELNYCHKLGFFCPYIFATRC